MVEQVLMNTASPMEGVTEGETLEAEEWVEGEWAPDPNEPRYCLCNQVSYGDMVACDNPEVIIVYIIFVGFMFSLSIV